MELLNLNPFIYSKSSNFGPIAGRGRFRVRGRLFSINDYFSMINFNNYIINSIGHVEKAVAKAVATDTVTPRHGHAAPTATSRFSPKIERFTVRNFFTLIIIIDRAFMKIRYGLIKLNKKLDFN